MKNIYLILAVLLILTSCNEESSDHRTYDGLKGNVKSIESRTYEAKDVFGEIQKGTYLDESFKYTEYDFDGNRIKEGYYVRPSYYLHVSTYDENKNRVEMIEYKSSDHNSSGKINTRESFIYNDEGNLKEKNWFGSDNKLGTKYVYIYDDEGCLTEEKTYRADGSFHSNVIYKNDSDCRTIERLESRFDSRTTYKYNSSGFMIEEIHYDTEDGSIESSNKYRLNDDGYILEWIKYDEYFDDEIKKYVYERDRDNQLISREVYDQNELLIESYSFDYQEIDEYGNWTHKVEFESGRPTKIIERKIDYH